MAFVLLFAVGEDMDLGNFGPRDWVLFAFFPVGVCLGLVLAWAWDCLGGGLAVISLAAFYAVNAFESGSFPRGPAFVAVAAPGFLFLLGGWLSGRDPGAKT